MMVIQITRPTRTHNQTLKDIPLLEQYNIAELAQ